MGGIFRMPAANIQHLIAIVAYMAVVIIIGIVFAKRANKDTEAYFLGGRTLGLLVEAVSDIIDVSDDMVQPTPDVACDTVKMFVKGLFAIDGRMVSLISLDRVLPEMEAEAA